MRLQIPETKQVCIWKAYEYFQWLKWYLISFVERYVRYMPKQLHGGCHFLDEIPKNPKSMC